MAVKVGRSFSGRLAATAFFVLACAASSARADEDAVDPAARDVFKGGLEAAKREDWAAACSAFAEAHRRDPHVGYVVNLARCEAKLGHLVTALARWREAADLAAQRNDPRLDEVGRGLAAHLRTVPKVRVRLQGEAPSGLTATLDGDDIALDEERPVDPGPHAIEVRAFARKTWTTSVVAQADGATQIVTAPELGSDAVDAHTTPLRMATPPAVRPTPRTAQRIGGLAAIGAGAIGLGLGTYFGLRAMSINDDSKGLCNGGNDCPTEEGVQLRNRAQAAGTASTVAFVAGGVAAITGLVLVLTSGSSTKAPSAAARLPIDLATVPGGVGFEARSRW